MSSSLPSCFRHQAQKVGPSSFYYWLFLFGYRPSSFCLQLALLCTLPLSSLCFSPRSLCSRPSLAVIPDSIHLAEPIWNALPGILKLVIWCWREDSKTSQKCPEVDSPIILNIKRISMVPYSHSIPRLALTLCITFRPSTRLKLDRCALCLIFKLISCIHLQSYGA